MIFYIISIFLIILILFLIFLEICSDITFKKAFLKKKKNKEEAFNSLKKRNMLDESIYDKYDFEDVSIISKDNLTLKGHIIEPFKNSNKFIILVHGYSANYHIHMPFVPLFIKKGFNILLVDERNHGESEGKFPSYGYFESEDLNLWIDFLEKRKGKELFLGLHGQSMGGATVLICGAKNPKVKFIIDDCGYSSAKAIIKDQIKKVKFIPFTPVYYILRKKVKKRYGFDLNDVNPINDIENSKTPILFIHGEADKYVPCSMSIEMFNKHNNPKDKLFTVKNAIHLTAYDMEKEEYERIIDEFLENIQ